MINTEKKHRISPNSLANLKRYPKGVTGNPLGKPKKTKLEKITEKATKEVVMKFLEENALGAAKRVKDLSKEAKNEKVKLSANQDILDRTGVIGKGTADRPIQLNQIIVKINDILEDDRDRESQ